MAEKRYANTRWDDTKEFFGGKATPDAPEDPRQIPQGYYGLDMGTGNSSASSDQNFVEQDAPAPHGMTGLDYGNPSGTGYNAYPGAGMGDPAAQRPAYTPPQEVSTTGAMANGAMAGSAAGPWGAVIGAGVGLLNGIVEKKKAAAAAKMAYELAQKQHAQNQVEQGRNKQFNAAGAYGQGQQSAISNLLNVFARTQRH